MATCVVGTWEATALDSEDRAAVARWLEAGGSMALLHANIAELYSAPFALTTYKDHVRGRCRCGDKAPALAEAAAKPRAYTRR